MRTLVTRRQALIGGLCLCCLPRAGFAAESLALDEVGPGVFMRRGPDAEATSENADAICNAGFIIGKVSVLVTESGGSFADGQWLRAEIRKRTDKPIRHVVMSHIHPDHIFGAGAFLEDDPAFIGHANLRGMIDARGEYYRGRLADILGADKAGKPVYPTVEVKEGSATEVDIGERKLTLTAHGTAHTNTDLSMLDSASGLLFTGDLLSVGRIPSLDGSLLGWLKRIDELKATGAKRAVPGHGPTVVDAEPAFAALARYLGTLRDETKKAVDADVPIEKAVRTVAQSERENWHLFENYNPRNVTQAYQELEWQ